MDREAERDVWFDVYGLPAPPARAAREEADGIEIAAVRRALIERHGYGLRARGRARPHAGAHLRDRRHLGLLERPHEDG